MKAELITPISNDLLTVNSARVSMNKESTVFTFRKDKPKGSDEGLVSYLADHTHWTPFSHVLFTLESDHTFVDLRNVNPEDIASAVWRTDSNSGFFKFRTSLYGWVHLVMNDFIDGDAKYDVIHFIRKLAPECAKALLPGDLPDFAPIQLWEPEHEHDPAFIDVTMRETVPIFVARQRFKHMIGTTYNEVSRRYVDDDVECYKFPEYRSRPDKSIKQGSAGVHPESDYWKRTARYNDLDATALYYKMVNEGVAPEMARGHLPQTMLTSYYVTASLNAWKRAYLQRIDSHAQIEIQELAKQWDTNLRASQHERLWTTIISS